MIKGFDLNTKDLRDAWKTKTAMDHYMATLSWCMIYIILMYDILMYMCMFQYSQSKFTQALQVHI